MTTIEFFSVINHYHINLLYPVLSLPLRYFAKMASYQHIPVPSGSLIVNILNKNCWNYLFEKINVSLYQSRPPWLNFVIKNEWSLLTEGRVVADKANMVQAGTSKVTVAESLVKFWWRSIAVLTPVALDFVGDSAGFDSCMVDGETPSVMFICLSGPQVMIDVSGTKGSFQTVLVSFLWYSFIMRGRICRIEWSWTGADPLSKDMSS